MFYLAFLLTRFSYFVGLRRLVLLVAVCLGTDSNFKRKLDSVMPLTKHVSSLLLKRLAAMRFGQGTVLSGCLLRAKKKSTLIKLFLALSCFMAVVLFLSAP